MIQMTITVLDNGVIKYDQNLTGDCKSLHFGIMYQALLMQAAELVALCVSTIVRSGGDLAEFYDQFSIGQSMYLRERRQKHYEGMELLKRQKEACSQDDKRRTEDTTGVTIEMQKEQ